MASSNENTHWGDNGIYYSMLYQVCDRYCYSGVAFSAAKGMDMDWCKSCDKGLIAPDCIIYLDMPVEEAAQVNKKPSGLSPVHWN